MKTEANDDRSGYQAKATGLTAAMPRDQKSLTVGKRGVRAVGWYRLGTPGLVVGARARKLCCGRLI